MWPYINSCIKDSYMNLWFELFNKFISTRSINTIRHWINWRVQPPPLIAFHFYFPATLLIFIRVRNRPTHLGQVRLSSALLRSKSSPKSPIAVAKLSPRSRSRRLRRCSADEPTRRRLCAVGCHSATGGALVDAIATERRRRRDWPGGGGLGGREDNARRGHELNLIAPVIAECRTRRYMRGCLCVWWLRFAGGDICAVVCVSADCVFDWCSLGNPFEWESLWGFRRFG